MDIHRQISEEIYNLVEDTTYKMPPYGHGDETEFKDKGLMKRIKKTKQASKPRLHVGVPDPSLCKNVQIDTKCKKIFQTKMSPLGFVAMTNKFNEAQKRAILDVVIELPRDLYKWLVNNFDTYSVTLYITTEKKIEITQIDVEEFYGKKPKDPKYNEVLSAWRKEWNLEDGTPKLSQMAQYILNQADVEETLFYTWCLVSLMDRRIYIVQPTLQRMWQMLKT
ncbi:hypothetical protein Cgig2_009293 [Carnegiea gigantea]|uniref:Uncharacterized protein n=1 Tax=Carnegiea gigantea TaxID=171969 RepID=A0A9Q1JRN7_9CARY|nr:hypothetical protein Cgig2_009293 [Carnegiea gigantea]